MALAYDHHWVAEPNLLIPGKKPFSKVVVNDNNQLTENLSALFLFNEEQPFEYITKTYKPTTGTIFSDVDVNGKHFDIENAPKSYITLGLVDDFVPLDRVTIGLAYKRNNAFSSNSEAFGQIPRTSNDARVQTTLVWSNAFVYWDFGGIGTSNRLAYQHIQATNYEIWVFRAGPSGQSIWLNGVEVASHALTSTRISAGTDNFAIGAGDGVAGKDSKWYTFFISRDELSDGQIESWSRNPYQLFKPIG